MGLVFMKPLIWEGLLSFKVVKVITNMSLMYVYKLVILHIRKKEWNPNFMLIKHILEYSIIMY